MVPSLHAPPECLWLVLSAQRQKLEGARNTYFYDFRYKDLPQPSYDGCKIILDWLVKQVSIKLHDQYAIKIIVYG
jgi:hypothetical protein